MHHVPDGRGDSYDCTISETVTSMVPLGLQHRNKMCENNHVEFNKRLHDNIQYIPKEPDLIYILGFV